MRPLPPRSRSRQGIFISFISFISAIVLAIETMFGDIFVRFNDYFSVLNDDLDFELEYDLRDVLSSHTNDTIGTPGYTPVPGFNLRPTGVGLAEFDDLGCDLCAVLSAPAIVPTVTTITVANRSGSNGPHTQTQQYPATPTIASNDKLGLTGVGLHGFAINIHLFDVVFNENELEYDLNNIFHIYLNQNYYDNSGIANPPGMFIFNVFIFLFCGAVARELTSRLRKRELKLQISLRGIVLFVFVAFVSFYFVFFVIQKTGPSDFATALGINTFNINTVLLWQQQLTEMTEWIKLVKNHINIGCIFNSNIDRIGLQYDMLSGMFIFMLVVFYFLFFFYFYCFVVKYQMMLFLLLTFWLFFYFGVFWKVLFVK